MTKVTYLDQNKKEEQATTEIQHYLHYMHNKSKYPNVTELKLQRKKFNIAETLGLKNSVVKMTVRKNIVTDQQYSGNVVALKNNYMPKNFDDNMKFLTPQLPLLSHGFLNTLAVIIMLMMLITGFTVGKSCFVTTSITHLSLEISKVACWLFGSSLIVSIVFLSVTKKGSPYSEINKRRNKWMITMSFYALLTFWIPSYVDAVYKFCN